MYKQQRRITQLQWRLVAPLDTWQLSSSLSILWCRSVCIVRVYNTAPYPLTTKQYDDLRNARIDYLDFFRPRGTLDGAIGII